MHFIDIQQNVILVFCIWAKIWEFGHTIHFDIIQNSYSYLPAWEPIFFHSNTIEPSEIFKLTSQHLLFFLLHAGPFLFMIDISLDFGEVLKQAAVGVSDLWL